MEEIPGPALEQVVGLQDASLVVRRWGGDGLQGAAGMMAAGKY